MKLYFVRHGRTEWNEEGRFQGSNGDSPLLDSSLDQLKSLGQSLAHIPFDQVYSSDQNRAIKSAEIIMRENQKHLQLHSTPALREWQLGRLEGSKIATIEAIYPQQIQAFRSNLAQFKPSIFGAESLYATTKRIKDFVYSLEDSDYQNVLIVGHGASLVASIRSLMGYGPGQLRASGGIKNSSLTILETEDFKNFHLLTWNNLDHLEKLEA